MKSCAFRTEEPYIIDVYKVPDVRYLCRCPERMEKMDRMQSDRFIGETDCETCPYRKEVQ